MSELQPSPNGASPEAIAHLFRLAALAPRDADLRLTLARRLLECDLRDDAVAQIREAIAISPNHLDARKLLDQVLTARVRRI